MKNKMITLNACVSFEIALTDAVKILADPKPSDTLGEWIDNNKMVVGSGQFNHGNLERPVMATLLENAIAETKLLTMSCDPDVADKAAGFVKE